MSIFHSTKIKNRNKKNEIKKIFFKKIFIYNHSSPVSTLPMHSNSLFPSKKLLQNLTNSHIFIFILWCCVVSNVSYSYLPVPEDHVKNNFWWLFVYFFFKKKKNTQQKSLSRHCTVDQTEWNHGPTLPSSCSIQKTTWSW